MSFVIHGLSPDTFRPLFALDDGALAARNIRRVVADADRGFPCRVTLEDARQGETLLLLPFLHLEQQAGCRLLQPGRASDNPETPR